MILLIFYFIYYVCKYPPVDKSSFSVSAIFYGIIIVQTNC